jgi:hypothetical protein
VEVVIIHPKMVTTDNGRIVWLRGMRGSPVVGKSDSLLGQKPIMIDELCQQQLDFVLSILLLIGGPGSRAVVGVLKPDLIEAIECCTLYIGNGRKC